MANFLIERELVGGCLVGKGGENTTEVYSLLLPVAQGASLKLLWSWKRPKGITFYDEDNGDFGACVMGGNDYWRFVFTK